MLKWVLGILNSASDSHYIITIDLVRSKWYMKFYYVRTNVWRFNRSFTHILDAKKYETRMKGKFPNLIIKILEHSIA